MKQIHFQNISLIEGIFKFTLSKNDFQNCSLKIPLLKNTFLNCSLKKNILKVALLKGSFLKNAFSKKIHFCNCSPKNCFKIAP